MSDYKVVPMVATIDMHNAAALSGLCGQAPTLTADGRVAWSPADPTAIYHAMLAAAPPFVVTDEMVEKAAMAVERMVTADGYGWTDEQFSVWWNKDPYFCKKVNSWPGFTGTRKQKRIHETRAAIEAVLGGGG